MSVSTYTRPQSKSLTEPNPADPESPKQETQVTLTLHLGKYFNVYLFLLLCVCVCLYVNAWLGHQILCSYSWMGVVQWGLGEQPESSARASVTSLAPYKF